MQTHTAVQDVVPGQGWVGNGAKKGCLQCENRTQREEMLYLKILAANLNNGDFRLWLFCTAQISGGRGRSPALVAQSHWSAISPTALLNMREMETNWNGHPHPTPSWYGPPISMKSNVTMLVILDVVVLPTNKGLKTLRLTGFSRWILVSTSEGTIG